MQSYEWILLRWARVRLRQYSRQSHFLKRIHLGYGANTSAYSFKCSIFFLRLSYQVIIEPTRICIQEYRATSLGVYLRALCSYDTDYNEPISMLRILLRAVMVDRSTIKPDHLSVFRSQFNFIRQPMSQIAETELIRTCTEVTVTF